MKFNLNFINMKKIICLLLVIILFSCNKQQEKPDPKLELEVVEQMIKTSIYDLKSKEMIEIQLLKLDSIIIKFPNSNESKRAEYLLSKKDSLYALIDKTKQIEKNANSKLFLSERKAYQEKLRNLFLDQGLDIKVSISGENYDELLLEYVLFNDVWFRKFETGGNFDEWFRIGFTKITLSDKNGYGKYMTPGE